MSRPFSLEHMPRRQKPSCIVDQEQLINKVENDPEYSFFYMSYAVDRSSEYFNPYALKYKKNLFFNFNKAK